MHFSLQILSTYSTTTLPSLLLSFPTRSYLINAPSGLQRILAGKGKIPSKLAAVVNTRDEWRWMAGLPGLVLTLCDRLSTLSLQVLAEKEGITALRDIINRKNYTIKFGTEYQDDNVTIQSIQYAKRKRQASKSYIITGPQLRGKFLVEKARALKIPAGPLYSKLSSGESIQVNGATIHPSQVLDTPPKPVTMLVIHLQTPSDLDSFASWYRTQQLDWTTVVAMLGPTIHSHVDWKAFVDKLAENSFKQELLVMSADVPTNVIMLEKSARLRWKTSLLSPQIFPDPFAQLIEPQDEKMEGQGSLSMRYPEPRDTLLLCPKLVFHDGENLKWSTYHPSTDTSISSLPSIEAAKRMQNETNLSSQSFLEKIITPETYSIIPLGTGSAIPSSYRNVSSTLVCTASGHWFLDCGESTTTQLISMIGVEAYERVLKGVRGVVVSHLHADHCLGLASIIHDWAEQNPAGKLSIIGPARLGKFLKGYEESYEETLPIQFYPANVETMVDGLDAWTPVRVHHCNEAYAHVITLSGYKVGFSGDCRPSTAFAKASTEADVMIHEATFCDAFKEDAVMKKHCTISEAVGVFTESRAKKLLLTHFSQRYSKIPALSSVMMLFDQMVLAREDFEGYEVFCRQDEKVWRQLVEGEEDEVVHSHEPLE
jgi:ribonuclease Z